MHGDSTGPAAATHTTGAGKQGRAETAGHNTYSVVLTQWVALAVFAGATALWRPIEAQALLLGGASVALPNTLLAWAATRRKPGGWLLVQGLVKFFMTVVLMAAAMKFFSPSPPGFFGGLAAALIAHAVGGYRLSVATPSTAAANDGTGNRK